MCRSQHHLQMTMPDWRQSLLTPFLKTMLSLFVNIFHAVKAKDIIISCSVRTWFEFNQRIIWNLFWERERERERERESLQRPVCMVISWRTNNGISRYTLQTLLIPKNYTQILSTDSVQTQIQHGKLTTSQVTFPKSSNRKTIIFESQIHKECYLQRTNVYNTVPV